MITTQFLKIWLLFVHYINLKEILFIFYVSMSCECNVAVELRIREALLVMPCSGGSSGWPLLRRTKPTFWCCCEVTYVRNEFLSLVQTREAQTQNCAFLPPTLCGTDASLSRRSIWCKYRGIACTQVQAVAFYIEAFCITDSLRNLISIGLFNTTRLSSGYAEKLTQ